MVITPLEKRKKYAKTAKIKLNSGPANNIDIFENSG